MRICNCNLSSRQMEVSHKCDIDESKGRMGEHIGNLADVSSIPRIKTLSLRRPRVRRREPQIMFHLR